ncbi:hypothetical protein K491DRAFT_698978 [Lophiostoma macrostomum CBS 122681]|uniref:N-acetyltransferase domain-containing protein n=1 Tax=Lophiostoma macrostomum CBS 122681 TaxID=1314788 RepID=A0A6A6SKD6_9PLEO|nr:hypothetical protein K491DRAFT_698978 [Lophiostoma macrostomum CBS 122681]
MDLQLDALQIEDFYNLISHSKLHPPGQDLVGPPTPLCCPVQTPQEASTRLAFHFAKQRARFLGDPTVRYMKVVDRGRSNSIISIARWHYYPQGYKFESEIHWETHDLPNSNVPVESHDQGQAPTQEQAQQIPKDFNIPLHNHILRTRDRARASWIPANEPCWILMHMVTHPSHRGKGAAGMLIQWGIEQAEKDRVPAYLEAGVMGRPIYERHGFVQVGEPLKVNLEGYGGVGTFVMCTMAYVPKWKGARREV